MFRRSKTVLLKNVLQTQYDNVKCNNITKMQLLDTNHDAIILFEVHHTNVYNISIFGNNVSYVNDVVYDNTMKNFLSNILGYKVDKCVSRYIILKNNKPVAKVFIDCLYNTIKFKCNTTYKWRALEKEDTYKIELPIDTTYMSEILDVIGADAESLSRSGNLHNVDLFLSNGSINFDRKSLPMYL